MILYICIVLVYRNFLVSGSQTLSLSGDYINKTFPTEQHVYVSQRVVCGPGTK